MSQNQPKGLTSKELALLEDQLGQEALASKKCDNYAQRFTEPALKTFASQIAQHHRQRYDNLMRYLNSHTSN